MKIIIMCAGSGKRWGYHKHKQLSLVGGVPNLIRTIEMIKRTGYEDIWVTVSKDKKYYFEALNLNLIMGNNKYETQRYSNAFPLEGETVFLYGDVVYNELDLERILYGTDRTTFYGRYAGNPLTGKKYGELLGINVVDFEKFETAVRDTNKLLATGKLKRAIGWEVYRVHEGLDPTWNTPVNENFVELSYYTDDFDTKKELNNNCLDNLSLDDTYEEKSSYLNFEEDEDDESIPPKEKGRFTDDLDLWFTN